MTKTILAVRNEIRPNTPRYCLHVPLAVVTSLGTLGLEARGHTPKTPKELMLQILGFNVKTKNGTFSTGHQNSSVHCNTNLRICFKVML